MYLKLNGSGRVLWERLAEPCTESRTRRGARRARTASTRSAPPPTSPRSSPTCASAACSSSEPVFDRDSHATVGVAACAGCPRSPPREIADDVPRGGRHRVVELLIRWVPLPRLSRLLGVRSTSRRPSRGAAALLRRRAAAAARRQLRCTCRVADVWPFSRGPCLRRSLVAGHLLRVTIPAVRLGVAGAGDTLLAHAWLEIDDRPLENVAGLGVFQDVVRADGIDDRRTAHGLPQCGLRLRSEIELHLPIASDGGLRRRRALGPTSTTRPTRRRASHRSYDLDDASLVHAPPRPTPGTACASTNCGEFEISADLAEVRSARTRPASRAAADPDGRHGQRVPARPARRHRAPRQRRVARRRGARVRRAVGARQVDAGRAHVRRRCRPRHRRRARRRSGRPVTCVGRRDRAAAARSAAPLAADLPDARDPRRRPTTGWR